MQLLSVGSYPSPFLGYLLFYITDPSHKSRYPQKGVGYEPLGKAPVLSPNPSLLGLLRRLLCLGKRHLLYGLALDLLLRAASTLRVLGFTVQA